MRGRKKLLELGEVGEGMGEKVKGMERGEKKEVGLEGGRVVWKYGEEGVEMVFERIGEERRGKEVKWWGLGW